MKKWKTPKISWRDAKVPVSVDFDDPYFSSEGGLAEARHVFLKGIGIPDVWIGREQFAIGELGFGTGLNFLVTLQAWRETAPSSARLDYVAIEGFPISVSDRRRALGQFPEIAPLADSLADAIPDPEPGFHLITFDGGRVWLLLIYSDVAKALDDRCGSMDAWYLDGFSPSRNPEMGRPSVFSALARLSRIGTRLATFSAAGHVRRGLQEVGFDVEKRSGFGRKWECLNAMFGDDNNEPASATWCRRPTAICGNGPVAVIGAGIGGASVARALATRGIDVRIFDAGDGPAAGASGTPAGLVQPRALTDESSTAKFLSQAYGHAVRTYDALDTTGGSAWSSRGLLVMGRDASDRARYAKLNGSQLLSEAEVRETVGVAVGGSGVWFDNAGTLNTQIVCDGLLEGIDAKYNCTVSGLDAVSSGWRLADENGETVGESTAVVIACGMASRTLANFPDLGLVANRGQVTFLKPNPDLRAPLTFGGYLTPLVEGPQGDMHVLGATVDRGEDIDAERRAADDDRNLELLARRGPDMMRSPIVIGSWAGLRAETRDRLPLAGAVPDGASYLKDYQNLHQGRPTESYPPATYQSGLYVLSGLGSRGFMTAPLVGEMLAALITGMPVPVPLEVMQALHPARFLIRNLRRGGTHT